MRTGRSYGLILVACALLALLASGCRRGIIEVQTTPPGADVYIQGQHTNEYEFDWYHVDYTIVATHPGYRDRLEYLRVNPPWWQIIPLDFIVDILPFTITDKHIVDIGLEPRTGQQHN